MTDLHTETSIPPIPSIPIDVTIQSERDRPTKKRKQRVLLACDGCRRRRARCEIISGHACHRCESLGENCSLTAFQASANVHRTPLSVEQGTSSSTTISDMTEAQTLCDRVLSLESQIMALHSRLDQQNSGIQTFPSAGNTEPRSLDTLFSPTAASVVPTVSPPALGETWNREAQDPETFGMTHHGISNNNERGLVDPVAAGVLTADHAEAAYQTFKYQCVVFFPHSSLLLTRSRLPAHPFLRAACLVYATRCSSHAANFSTTQVKALEDILVHNLNSYHRGCKPTLESIMAGLVLSLLPPRRIVDPTTPADFDPARMIGMAFGQLRELGHTMFVERLVDTLDSGMPPSLATEALDSARLHLAVLSRTMWLSLSRTPLTDFPLSITATHRRLLALLRKSNVRTELDTMLTFEHSALDILVNSSQRWRELERVRTPSAVILNRGNALMQSTIMELDSLRVRASSEMADHLSLPWFSCQVTYYRWWAAVRNVWYAYRLPSPLIVEAVCEEWEQGMRLAAETSTEMISCCLTDFWDLDTFPKAIGNALILCYQVLSTAIMHFQHYHSEEPLPSILEVSDKLLALESIFSRVNGSLGDLFHRTKDNLEGNRQRVQAAAQTSAFSLSDFTFDMGFIGRRSGQSGDPSLGGIDPMVDPLVGVDYWWNWSNAFDTRAAIP